MFNSFGRNAAVARSVMKKYWTCWSKIKNKKRTRKQDLLLRIADITQFGCICYYFFLSFCFTSCFIQYVFLKTSVSKEGRWRGRHQSARRKMESKTSVSHRGRWRGRHQPRRKMERKTSATEEDGEKDISHGRRWRGRHQPRRKMERKRAATTRRSEDCPSGPAPLSSVQTKTTTRRNVCVIVNARSALCKQRNTRRDNVWRSLSMHVQPT